MFSVSILAMQESLNQTAVGLVLVVLLKVPVHYVTAIFPLTGLGLTLIGAAAVVLIPQALE